MNLKLQIMMGLNCNFLCGHCLNNSGPGNRKADFGAADTESILSSVTRHSNISAIGFSGGEPLLYLNEIEDLLKSIGKIRPLNDIFITLTSNGSLISKNLDQLKRLKIDSILLSYDKFHQDFLSLDDFEDVVRQCQVLFKNVEINFVTDDEKNDLDLVKNIALRNDIKVHISNPVRSGRFKPSNFLDNPKTFKQISCPNLLNQNLNKISYFPGKGYSICCGPLIFDDYKASDIVAFSSIEEVIQSPLRQVLVKTQNVYTKTSGTSSCDRCTNIFKSSTVKKNLSKFVQNELWNNFCKLEDFSKTELNELDSLFQPKYVFTAPKGSLESPPQPTIEEIANLKVDLASKLSPSEIEQASSFTKESFYGVHHNHYYESDLQRFYSQQKYFFSLPLQTVRHFNLQDQLVAFLVLGKIENHPHFKETVWHIGYWGMSSEITDRSARDAIKCKWLDILFKHNELHRIVSCVDFFNFPAIKMAHNFGFQKVGVRLDPRV